MCKQSQVSPRNKTDKKQDNKTKYNKTFQNMQRCLMYFSKICFQSYF